MNSYWPEQFVNNHYLLLLPDELIKLILFNLNYKEIVLFTLTCKRVYSIDLKPLLEKIKYKGFPRKEKKCIIYNLSNIPDENKILHHLFNNNAIYGDLIVFDCQYVGNVFLNKCQIRIFDGSKLIKLLCNTNHFAPLLPFDFKVIENNVPIDYWNDNTLPIHILNTHVVWFNNKLVSDQFKIEYGLLKDSSLYGLWTYFNYKGQRYRIIYDYPMHEDENIHVDNINYNILNYDHLYDMINGFNNKLSNDYCRFLISSDGDCYKNDGFTLFYY